MEKKNKFVAIIIAIFLGGLGIHDFYLGREVKGLLMLFFCWTFIPAFIALIDILALVCMSKKDFDKRYN